MKREQSAWRGLLLFCISCVDHVGAGMFLSCHRGRKSLNVNLLMCSGGCVQASWPRTFDKNGEQSVWRELLSLCISRAGLVDAKTFRSIYRGRCVLASWPRRFDDKGEQSAWRGLLSLYTVCVGHLSATFRSTCRGRCVQALWRRRFHQKGEQSVWRALLFSYTKII